MSLLACLRACVHPSGWRVYTLPPHSFTHGVYDIEGEGFGFLWVIYEDNQIVLVHPRITIVLVPPSSAKMNSNWPKKYCIAKTVT